MLLVYSPTKFVQVGNCSRRSRKFRTRHSAWTNHITRSFAELHLPMPTTPQETARSLGRKRSPASNGIFSSHSSCTIFQLLSCRGHRNLFFRAERAMFRRPVVRGSSTVLNTSVSNADDAAPSKLHAETWYGVLRWQRADMKGLRLWAFSDRHVLR